MAIDIKALEKLVAMRKQAEINAAGNTDEQALGVAALYPDWEDITDGTTLVVGERVNYKDILYKVIQEHKKQADWNPVDAPSQFAKVLIPDPNVVPEWEQPESTNGYSTGDHVSHNGKTWESLVDNNVWEPGAVGSESLWKEVQTEKKA